MKTDDDKASPVRAQYLRIKRQYPDTLVLFRLGDFYEAFDADAELAARELDIVLTARPVSKGVAVPMAGIPYHALEGYLAVLIGRGHRVAICEQIGSVPVNGLVPREVVRVVTPGTVVETGLLEDARNNYLACCVFDGTQAGFAFVDITTGEFKAAEFRTPDSFQVMARELARIRPAEVLLAEEAAQIAPEMGLHIQRVPAWKFELGICRENLTGHFQVATLAGFGLADAPLALRAAGVIVGYLREMQPPALRLLTGVAVYHPGTFMQLDASTRRNLELTETIRGGSVRGSLLGLLDCTVTPMGARLFRQWFQLPLLDVDQICSRQAGVWAGRSDGVLRANARKCLKIFGDLERLVNRVLGGTATPRDVGAIRSALRGLPALRQLLSADAPEPLNAFAARLAGTPELLAVLESAVVPEPPVGAVSGGIVAAGWSAELDGIVESSRAAREWIAGLEPSERQRTGIRTLRVGFNRVFGYYIEISRAAAVQAPENYVRKQTLVNAERFITQELKEYETLVLNAEEQINTLEQRLFVEVCERIAAEAPQLLLTAQVLAELDALLALGEVASRHNFARPQVVVDDVLELRGCWHPVVADMLSDGQRFVPNDCSMPEAERIWVLTGPNMSGKSTFLRQVALCVLLAQVGSGVPAASARIGVVDRIFTRIGAQDEIYSGQSTFMVEMVETANILQHATARSLLVLDEVGRGTSTYDGLSLAWAILEFVHNRPGLRAKTLFATHYHELTQLSEQLEAVANYNVRVSEERGEVVFTHTIAAGGADGSYGIHVAQLAGIPRLVIQRAQEILSALELAAGRGPAPLPAGVRQMSMFSGHSPLLDEIDALDLAATSPLQALNILSELQRRLKAAGAGKF